MYSHSLHQVITSTLWDILGDQTLDPFQTSSLLYQIHNCLSSGTAETVIGHRIGNAHVEWSDVEYADLNSSQTVINFEPRRIDRITKYKLERLADMKIMCTPPPQTTFDCNESLTERECDRFRKFELLWEHGRETHNAKGFEGTLLKVLDQLALPCYSSIRTFVTKWLQESLLHGDLSRLIRPLLKMMLSPNTKRISVVHAHLIKRDSDDNVMDSMYDRSDEMDGENVADKDVYAISSEDGNIKYHIEMPRSKKRSPIRSLQKKFFGVTIGNKNKTSNYISDKSALPSESVR